MQPDKSVTWVAMRYLEAIGFRKPGRGRPPKGSDEQLAIAADQGYKFSDWPKANTVVKVPARKVTVQAVTNTGSYDTPPQLWFGDTTKFVDPHGKEISINEVCANCRPHKSLAWCHCSFPVAISSKNTGEIVTRLSRQTGREMVLPIH